ncbi:hypothetical protein CYY_006564 [Polysphondylium violaceum]|uniref:Squalene monooxygenase n=1 Tax=Polysphondylium violaceum TaxID=133409 RepID=A0A8J4V5U2_9MYCE|nr:hypothetical protein CYY_006564 [Polysphondylium violaceum]
MEPINSSLFIEDQKFDIIIVGAGVAGAAFAYSLGSKGKKVLCLERDLSEPDRIVGELMQPGGVKQLRELGMEDCFDGIDSALVFGYGIFKESKGVKLQYPKDKNGSIINGYSFHHGRFVQKLRYKASTCQNVTLVEGTVKSLIEEDGVVYGVRFIENNKIIEISNQDNQNNQDNQDNNSNIKEVRAPLTLVCDGCFSNLRKNVINDPTPLFTSTFVGLVIRGCQLPFQSHGHVFLCNPAPILMYRIGSDEIRVLIDIPGKCPTNNDLKEFIKTVTVPQLPESLREALLTALDTDQLKKMPNSRLHPQTISKPGVIMIGDAWNMRHPLTGSGMTVALSDVNILSRHIGSISDLSDRKQISKTLQMFMVERKPMASTLNVLAGALYQVFSASNEHLRQACLGYLDLGGEFSAGPVSLLSGLRPKPRVLAMHFFAVAFYGVLKNLFPFPTPSKIIRSYRILCAASDIVVPLLRSEGVLKYLTFLCVALRLTNK